MRNRASIYTTELIKVSGIVSESIQLFRIWEPGMRASELRDAALRQGTLAKESSDRVWVITRYGFGLRYLGEGQRPARFLKRLVEADVSVAFLRQLFTIYTARINGLFADVAGGYYWDLPSRGITEISHELLVAFIQSHFGTAKIPKAWSDEGTKRVASGLLKTLVDFGYLAQGRGIIRPITPPNLLAETACFITYEARERGVSDSAIIDEPAFSLFGLDRFAALEELKRQSGKGHLIVQSSGDLTRVSFNHSTMEDFIDAISR